MRLNMKCLCFPRMEKTIVVDSFLVNKLVVDHFSEHFQTYKAFESNEKDVVQADSLVNYKSFALQSAYQCDESQFIVASFSL